MCKKERWNSVRNGERMGGMFFVDAAYSMMKATLHIVSFPDAFFNRSYCVWNSNALMCCSFLF